MGEGRGNAGFGFVLAGECRGLGAVRGPAALALCVALLGCASDLRLDVPSRLCVNLSTSHVTDADDLEQTLMAGLGGALLNLGYAWSRRSTETDDRWSHLWYISEPKRGSGVPRNHVSVVYYGEPARHGQTCEVRVDVYADRWRAHGELEWRTFYYLRDGVLPGLMPGAAVSVLDHPGLRTWPWEVPDLAARFAPGEALPQRVRDQVDAYAGRSMIGRWWERSSAATWMAWKRTGGAHAYGAGMYFLYPPNWAAFLVFALAVAVGRRLVVSGVWRTVGFVALAVVLLMPVRVPTFVGAIYMPHGFVQVYDFDAGYYFREPVSALAAALFTAALAWLVLRLLRRGQGGGSAGS